MNKQLTIKLGSMAISFEAAAERLLAPGSLENTPKRQRQGMSRRIEGRHNERAALACRKLAEAIDSGTVTEAPTITKALMLDATRKRIGSNGYYEVHEEQEYSKNDTFSQLVQGLIDPSKHYSADELAKRERDQMIQKLEEGIRFSPIPGFFPTPPDLIDRMLEIADLKPGMSVLEPSAGKGDICDRIRRDYPGVNIACCEINPTLIAILKAKGYLIEAADCMDVPAVIQYDAIIMNPPFERGQDMMHVRQMHRLLSPSGRIVAIMGTGGFYRKDGLSTEFRAWLESVPHAIEDIGPGAFKGKEVFRETGVNTKLVVIEAS